MARSSIISSRNQPTVFYLRPSHGLPSLNLGDLWIYRELIYFLTWRDIKVRYKQTALGAAWAVLQPVLQMVVFTLLFGSVAKLASDNVPYPIFSYTALLPWGLFSKAISDAGRSLVTNRSMITKVYFPRLVIPLASVLSGIVDFAIAFLVLVGMMVYYSTNPGGSFDLKLTSAAWSLPFFLLLTLVTALGVSLWLSALHVNYRDVGYVLPFITQIWFFVTPIVYSVREVVSTKWQLVYSLNPMVGVVLGFRWALLGTPPPDMNMLAASTGVALVVLVAGLVYFRHMERTFADEI
jgi:lipopolysaccharide transport system permease protein